MEAMFIVRFVPRLLYRESGESLELADRRVRGWCEMVVRLRGRERGSRGTSTIGIRYQATQ
jgi:hypothetical protein